MFSMKAFIFLLVSVITHNAFSQTDTAVLQRPAYKITLPVSGGYKYEYNIKAGPYLLEDNDLRLFPGETIFIETERTDESIKSMKVVKQNEHPEKTLIISFMQYVQNDDHKNVVHKNMVLQIVNPFAKGLKYSAQILMLMQKEWITADVQPVAAGSTSTETWPGIVTAIGLANWAFNK
jgi:hypothetical protein